MSQQPSTGIAAPFNGGPYHGSVSTLSHADPVAGQHHLWLVQVGDEWHGYQLVPLPDSDDEVAWSHLGKVSELPRLDPCA